jgi:hypothetical protein
MRETEKKDRWKEAQKFKRLNIRQKKEGGREEERS